VHQRPVNGGALAVALSQVGGRAATGRDAVGLHRPRSRRDGARLPHCRAMPGGDAVSLHRSRRRSVPRLRDCPCPPDLRRVSMAWRASTGIGRASPARSRSGGGAVSLHRSRRRSVPRLRDCPCPPDLRRVSRVWRASTGIGRASPARSRSGGGAVGRHRGPRPPTSGARSPGPAPLRAPSCASWAACA